MMVYENYSQTDVKWLGEIPEHWNLLPLRAIFEERKESNKNLDVDLILSLVKDVGIMLYSEKGDVGNKSKDDLSQYKIAREKDLVLNKMNAVIGSLGVSKYIGLVSPIYLVLFIRNHTECFIDYFSYVFQSKTLQESLSQYASGIMKIRESIEFLEFKKMRLPVPPIEEQKAISIFLDKKSVQIEKFIQDKTRFIELLKEQKEAVINEAVTKGIDNNVELKDSDIEWLGEIPKHWEIRKLKYCVSRKLKYGANETAELDNEDYPRYIRITDFNFDGTLKSDTFKSLLPEIAEDYLLDDGDILFARSGATVGKTFQFKNYDGLACFAGYLIKVSPNEKIMSSDFLFYYTKSYHYAQWKDIILNKATIENIGADKYNDLYIPIPPKNEQLKIVEHIENELNQIDKLIEKTTKEIELIKEYKTSLINEAVSGKIKIYKQKQVKASRETNIAFKRAVLGAYIIDNCLEDNTFGHVKFQKILYMCEAVNNLDFGSDYKRHAAGPYDPKMLRSIENMIKKSQWFESKKVQKRYVYKRLEKADDYKKYINRYWNVYNIDMLLELFKPMNTEQSEIIATLYSAWSDLLKTQLQASDDMIVNEVLNNWHESKKKIPKDRWLKALAWMKEMNLLVPNGAMNE